MVTLEQKLRAGQSKADKSKTMWIGRLWLAFNWADDYWCTFSEKTVEQKFFALCRVVQEDEWMVQLVVGKLLFAYSWLSLDEAEETA